MKKWKIGDIAELTIGGNQARAKDGLDGNIYYNHEDFKFDLERISLESYTMESSKNNDYFVKEGDVVINISSHLATIVGFRDENKKLTINFIKVNLNKKIDKAYFLYLYNFSSVIKRQKEIHSQGIGAVQRITLKSMMEMEIPILPIEEQRKIGKSYITMLKVKNSLDKYNSLIEKMTYKILEENIKGVR